MGKTKHGDNATGKRTKLYQVWIGMRARCNDPKHISYKHYGARGIQVDQRWDNFAEFREWSYEHGYEEPPEGVRSPLEIDRTDNNGPYSPENCRWVTVQENRQKQSRYKRYGAFGESKTMGRWAEDERCIVTYYVLRNRLQRGWDVEQAITTPANPPGVWHQPRTR